MRLVVDTDVCQGYGLCHDEAPELIELDEGGFAQVLGDGSVSDQLRDVAEKAIGMCPARALSLR
jgi:ferredoxin